MLVRKFGHIFYPLFQPVRTSCMDGANSSLPFTCGLSDGVEEVLEKLEAMDAENRPVSIFLSQGEELFQLWLTGKL